MQTGFHRAGIGVVVFGLRDVVQFAHAAEDVGTAHLGRLGARHRIDHRRSGGNACQGCHLRDAQLVQALAEIHFGGRADAVSALPQEDLVHVQGKYLLLGELGLHQQGDVDLAHFSLHVAPRREEHVARDLHGDGAGPLADAAGLQIGRRRPQDALPIDTVVLKESIVLGGQKRLDERFRQLLVAHRDAALVADGRNQPAVAGIDAQGHLQLHVPEAAHVGQSGLQVGIGADVGEDNQDDCTD